MLYSDAWRKDENSRYRSRKFASDRPAYRAAGSQPTIAERSEILPGPRTRLEAITGSSGAVLVRQYTEVGLLGHGAISVAAIMVTNVTSETETKGLLISPSEGTGGMRNAYVDYDEIPGLLSGIDYLASVDLATLKLEFCSEPSDAWQSQRDGLQRYGIKESVHKHR